MSPPRRFSVWFWLCSAYLAAGVAGASVYANLSYDVTDPAEYADFPPFEAGRNANHNDHLGAEYYCIAEAVADGRGFRDPFKSPTGPTAWMAPALCYLEAGLILAFDRDKVAVTNAVIVAQTAAIALAAVLTLAAARATAPRVPSAVVAGFATLGLVTRFNLAFQETHDSWLVLSAVTFVVTGAVFGRPWHSRFRALGWGVGGGLVALTSPVAGLGWGVLTLAGGLPRGRRGALAVALLAAGLTVSPWVVRNWVTFGRFIPVKSNLAYELYQSQCLNDQGRLSNKVFGTHPYATDGAERAECAEKGEMAFLDAKRAQFWAAVRAEPAAFADKAYDRLLAATVDYSPMDDRETERGVTYELCYLTHALPVLAAICLVAVAPVRRLDRRVWAGLALLAVYLAPYVVVSYYERYEFPLWGLKVLVLVWWLDAVLFRAPAEPA